MSVPTRGRGIFWDFGSRIRGAALSGSNLRDEFSAAVKRAVAQRVRLQCSNPGCRAPTSGPHEDPGRAVNVGVASHITAAASGGPRFNASLLPEERSGPENAIWLCSTCAKRIDTDVDRYSEIALREWKRDAEQLADQQLGRPLSIDLSFTSGAASVPQSADHDYAGVLAFEVSKLELKLRQQIEREIVVAKAHLDAGRFAMAADAYERLAIDDAVKLEPGLQFKILNNLAVAARAIERKEVALRAAKEARRLAPDNDIGLVTDLGTKAIFEEPGWMDEVTSQRARLERSDAGIQLLASTAYDGKQFETAVDYSARALSAGGKNHGSLITLGQSLVQLHREGEALKALSDVPASDQAFVVAQVMCAEVSYNSGRYSRDPNTNLEAAAEHLKQARIVAEAKGLDPQDWALARRNATLLQAAIDMVAGKADAALSGLATLQAESASDGRYWFLLGQVQASAGRWDEAIESLSRAAALEPTNDEVGVWLATALVNRHSREGKKEDLVGAEARLRELLRRGANGLAVLNLVSILLGTNRRAEAISILDRATEVIPEDIDVLVAEILVALDLGDDVRTGAIARKVLSRQPNETIAATCLGKIEFRAGRIDEAVTLLEAAIANPYCKSQFHVDAYVFLARALKRKGKIGDALEVLLAGMNRLPNEPRLEAAISELTEKP